MAFNLLPIWPKHKIEMQNIYAGRKVGKSLEIRVSGPDWISTNGAQGNIVMGLLL